jgi:hypothetical protein
MESKCKICDKSFKNDKGLHMHISKIHSVPLGEYYVNFFGKKDLHTNELLPFTNKDEYFNVDFLNTENLIAWSDYAPEDEVKEYLLRRLKWRIDAKKLNYAPSSVEIQLFDLPSIDLYKRFFGSYSEACKQLDVEPLLPKNITKDFFKENETIDQLKILVDTREQQPLSFAKTMDMKLDFGDYTIGAPHYSYTYVDRKSESDFKSTLSSGLNRFKREIERAKEFSSFIFVVVESSIEKIIKNNNYAPHEANLSYVWHNTRVLSHDYRDHCQFIFSGSRKMSQKLIPKLLFHGKKLWQTDMQYFIDKS